MISYPTLSFHMWGTTQAFRDKKQPVLHFSPELDVGGRTIASRPFRDWLVVGTEHQMHTWGELLLRLIPDEMLNFQDKDPWRWQQPSQLKRWRRFYRQGKDWPAFVWVTPLMPLIGRQLARQGIKPKQDVIICGAISSAEHEVTLRPANFKRITIDLRHLLFTNPPDQEGSPTLQVVERMRMYDSSPCNEVIIYKADDRVHKKQLDAGIIPANTTFYEGDPEGTGTGWLRTAHVTMVKLTPRGGGHYYSTAYYWGLRFDRVGGWSTSAIQGKDDFHRFVSHHPNLSYLLNTYRRIQ